MTIRTYVSSEGELGLAPLIDLALDFVARDSRWRRALVEQIAPRRHDVILDIGCGDGALALLLAHAAPGAEIVGVDADASKIAQARLRAAAAGARVSFVQGSPRIAPLTGLRTIPTKVVLNLVGRASSAPTKEDLLRAARAVLGERGAFHVAAFSPHRPALLRRFLQAPGPSLAATSTQPNTLPAAIRAAGFEAIEETARIPVAAGTIRLYRARAA